MLEETTLEREEATFDGEEPPTDENALLKRFEWNEVGLEMKLLGIELGLLKGEEKGVDKAIRLE